jgi:flagellar hook-associated protein 2
MESDPEGVAQLFAAREIAPTGPSQVPGVPGATFNDPNATTTYTSQGLATIIENLADSYINSVTGTLTRRSQNVTEQITQQNARIASFDSRLASRRGVLERQFQAMEEAIAKLQTQQSSLGQISLIG